MGARAPKRTKSCRCCLKGVSRSPKTAGGTHIFGDWRDFSASQDGPGHRFHNPDERVEHGKGGESGTGDWETRCRAE